MLGHAYSILQAREADGTRLVQLRNPWGSGVEWNGDWSNGSELWTPRMRKLLSYEPKAGKGIFWMAFSDFVHHYSRVHACRIFPPHAVHSVSGCWDDATGGGGFWGETFPRNPRFQLRRTDGLSRPTLIHVTLTHLADDGEGQSHSRDADTAIAVTFDLFRESGERFERWEATDRMRVSEQKVGSANKGSNMWDRQVSSTLTLEGWNPDGWMLVPYASQAKDRGRFVVTVYSAEPVELLPRADLK